MLIGIGFGMFHWVAAIIGVAIGVAILSLGEILMMPVASAYVADMAPPNMRGRYQGVWSSTFGFGLVLGPGIGAMLFSADPSYLWLTCLVLGLIAAMLVLLSPKPKPYKEQPDGDASQQG